MAGARNPSSGTGQEGRRQGSRPNPLCLIEGLARVNSTAP
jgi:hypothetical protein